MWHGRVKSVCIECKKCTPDIRTCDCVLCAPEDVIAVVEEKVSKGSKYSYGSDSSTMHLDELRKSSGLVVPQIFMITGCGYHADAIMNFFYNALGLLRSDIGQPPIILDHAIDVSASTLRDASSGYVYSSIYLCSISF